MQGVNSLSQPLELRQHTYCNFSILCEILGVLVPIDEKVIVDQFLNIFLIRGKSDRPYVKEIHINFVHKCF